MKYLTTKLKNLVKTLWGISHIPCYKQLIMINIILLASVMIFFIGGMLWVLDDDYLPEAGILGGRHSKKIMVCSAVCFLVALIINCF